MFSVLISNYNQREQVIEAIKSVEKQNFDDYEIIIGDDGSGHQERMKDFCKERGYKYIFQENLGYRLATLRNKQAEAASGDKLIFLDGDCTMRGNGFLNKLKRRLEHYSIIGFEKITYRDATEVERIDNNLETGHRKWWNFRGGSMAIKKDIFDRLEGFDEEFNGSWGMEDSDLILRAMKARIKMVFDKDLQVKHKWHKKRYDEKPIKNMDLLLRKHGKFIVWGWWSIE